MLGRLTFGLHLGGVRRWGGLRATYSPATQKISIIGTFRARYDAAAQKVRIS